MVCAAYLSLMPGKELGDVPGSDKLWHACSYALLALPIHFLFGTRLARLRVGLGLVAFGILLEIGQYYVPLRSFEVADIIANSLGVALCLLAGEWIAAYRSPSPVRVGTD